MRRKKRTIKDWKTQKTLSSFTARLCVCGQKMEIWLTDRLRKQLQTIPSIVVQSSRAWPLGP